MRFIVLIVFFLAASNAYADQCVDLAQAFARDREKTVSYSNRSIVQKANLCQSDYDHAEQSQHTSISAAYSIISGSFNSSDNDVRTLQHDMCQGHFGSYWSEKLGSASYDEASSVGAEVIKACIVANNSGFRLSNVAFNGSAFNLDIAWNGLGQIRLDGATVKPDGIASCTFAFGGAQKGAIASLDGAKMDSGTTIHANCERVGRPVDGHPSQILFKGGILTISAESGPAAAVPLVEYAVPELDESAAFQLAKKIDALSSALQGWGAEKDTYRISQQGVGGRTHAVNPPGDIKCKSGQYVYGVRVIKNDAGGLCDACTGGLEILCRPLNASE